MKLKRWEALGIIVLILLVLSIVLLLLAGAYFHWAFTAGYAPKEIKEGFSPKLLDELQNRYGITIPDEAQFIKGYNLPGWRDSYMAVLFEVPIIGTYESKDHMSDYISQRLKLEIRYAGGLKDMKQFSGSEWYEELGGQMEWMLDDFSTDFTYISYNIEADKLVIRFIGWRPSTAFP